MSFLAVTLEALHLLEIVMAPLNARDRDRSLRWNRNGSQMLAVLPLGREDLDVSNKSTLSWSVSAIHDGIFVVTKPRVNVLNRS